MVAETPVQHPQETTFSQFNQSVANLRTGTRYFGAGMLDAVAEGPALGFGLAFAVGVFLSISLSDLLPEVHFHRHDRGKLLAVLLVGVTLAYALYFVEAVAAQGRLH